MNHEEQVKMLQERFENKRLGVVVERVGNTRRVRLFVGEEEDGVIAVDEVTMQVASVTQQTPDKHGRIIVRGHGHCAALHVMFCLNHALDTRLKYNKFAD